MRNYDESYGNIFKINKHISEVIFGNKKIEEEEYLKNHNSMIKLKIKRNQTLSDKLRKMYNLSDEMLLFPETECDYNKDPLGTQKNSQITQWGNGYYRDINNKMYPKEIIDNYFDIVNEC